MREFKLVTHHEVDLIIGVLRNILPPLTHAQALDVVATVTSGTGAQGRGSTPARTSPRSTAVTRGPGTCSWRQDDGSLRVLEGPINRFENG